MKRNCKTCTLNTTKDTIETCKRMCYLRYSAQRKDRICDLEQKISKLSKTLTEIKDIAECLITTTDEYDSCYYKDKCSKCEVKEDCQYFKVEQILQKISEVEDG